jgi:hypothetical protein
MKRILLAVALFLVSTLPAAAQSPDVPLLSLKRLSLGLSAAVSADDKFEVKAAQLKVGAVGAYNLVAKPGGLPPIASLNAGVFVNPNGGKFEVRVGAVVVLFQGGK